MSNPSKRDGGRRTSRRQFTRAMALAAVSPLLGRPAPGAEDTPPKPPPDPVVTAAAALAEFVCDRHGKHLTEAQRRQVRRSIERGLRTGERLRKHAVSNGEGPDFVFSADVPGEGA